MTGKVPKPTGTHAHPHHHIGPRPGAVLAHQGHSDPRPDGAVLNMEGMTITASRSYLPQVEFTRCPSRGLEVRYFYTHGHDPACEIWKLGNRVYPPPFLIARADKTKDASILREGDTLSGATIREHDLKNWGFDDAGSSPLTALLFFIMDIGTEDDYRIILTIHKILPELDTQWDGRVVFLRSLVTGGTVIPVPNQSGMEERLKEVIAIKEIVEPMLAMANVIEAFEGLMMDFVWGLTGGWELKVAGEVTEKYVAREVMRRVLKYIRPKFLAIAKAYIVGFVKEMAKQVFKQIGNAIKAVAAGKLVTATGVGGDGPITIDQIHLLQSSKRLQDAGEHSKMDWEKCHAKGMEEGLKPFWNLFKDKRFAAGAIRRFLLKCTDPIEQFFFRQGLLKILQRAESEIGSAINSCIVEITEWIERKATGKPVTAEEAQSFVEAMLGDGKLFDKVKKYFEDNWEKLAKSALQTIEKEFIKAIHGAVAG